MKRTNKVIALVLAVAMMLSIFAIAPASVSAYTYKDQAIEALTPVVAEADAVLAKANAGTVYTKASLEAVFGAGCINATTGRVEAQSGSAYKLAADQLAALNDADDTNDNIDSANCEALADALKALVDATALDAKVKEVVAAYGIVAKAPATGAYVTVGSRYYTKAADEWTGLSKYNMSTLSAIEAALNAANAELAGGNDASIAAAVKAIDDAVKANLAYTLETLTAKIKALAAAGAKYSEVYVAGNVVAAKLAVQLGSYEPTSYAEYVAAVDALYDLYAAQEVTKAQVDAAIAALDLAADSLYGASFDAKAVAQFKVLNNQYSAMNAANYDVDAWFVLSKYIAKAQALLTAGNPNAVDPELKMSFEELVADALDLKAGMISYEAANAAIAAAKAITGAPTATGYANDAKYDGNANYAALKAALKALTDKLGTILTVADGKLDQPDVTAEVAALEAAIKAMDVAPKDDLDKYLDELAALEMVEAEDYLDHNITGKNYYAAYGWEAFEDALAAAKAATGADARAKALADLKAAFAKLINVNDGVADYDKADALFAMDDEDPALFAYNYETPTDAMWAELDNSMWTAKWAMLEYEQTPATITPALARLKAAVAAFKPKALTAGNTAAKAAALEAAAKLNQEDFFGKTWAAFQEDVKALEAANTNSDVAECAAIVKAAVAYLTKADCVDNLKDEVAAFKAQIAKLAAVTGAPEFMQKQIDDMLTYADDMLIAVYALEDAKDAAIVYATAKDAETDLKDATAYLESYLAKIEKKIAFMNLFDQAIAILDANDPDAVDYTEASLKALETAVKNVSVIASAIMVGEDTMDSMLDYGINALTKAMNGLEVLKVDDKLIADLLATYKKAVGQYKIGTKAAKTALAAAGKVAKAAYKNPTNTGVVNAIEELKAAIAYAKSLDLAITSKTPSGYITKKTGIWFFSNKADAKLTAVSSNAKVVSCEVTDETARIEGKGWDVKASGLWVTPVSKGIVTITLTAELDGVKVVKTLKVGVK